MTITFAGAVAVYGVFGVVTTGIFWGAFLLGRLWNRIDRVEKNVMALDQRMDRAGEKMSDLANDVQAMPDKFLTRNEAMMWRGSRAEDRQ